MRATGDWTPPAGIGFQPVPMNAPPAQPLGIGVQPGTTNIVKAKLVIVSGAGSGIFLYSGTPANGNPPVLWAVPPGVTTDPYGNPISSVLGIGTPGGPQTLIDASGDVTLTGTTGNQLSLMPGAALPFALTAALTGIMQTLLSLGSGDGSQTQAGVVSGITLGSGTTAKQATLVMSPYGAEGMGLLLQAQNDGATDVPYATLGTVTTQGGSVTFQPVMALFPYGLIVYGSSGVLTVTTRTSGSGTISIPASVSTILAECWGPGGGGANGNGFGSGAGGEYAAEPLLAVTGGGTVAYVVGSGGAGGAQATGSANPGANGSAASTITGSAVTVTANPGQGGQTSNVRALGGSGSTNTIHQPGGNGGLSVSGSTAGAGGGSSAGPSAAGNQGTDVASGGDVGGAGATAPAGGGAGGRGGDGTPRTAGPGFSGGAPGGGAGQGGVAPAQLYKAGGTASNGKIRTTWATGNPTILLSVLAGTSSVTDQFGTTITPGMHFTGPDGLFYSTGMFRSWRTSNTATINSLTAAPLSWQQPSAASTWNVVAGTYLVRGMVPILQGAAGPGNQAVQFTGTATVSFMQVRWQCLEGSSVFSTGIVTALNTNMTTGAIPLNTTGELSFEGLVTFSAAGTFGEQVLCVTAAADTWIAGAGAFLELCPV